MYVVFKSSQDAVILMMISAATVWLLVYLVAHINLIPGGTYQPDRTAKKISPIYPALPVSVLSAAANFGNHQFAILNSQ